MDPSYKPEHQSKSKLPSVTGKSSTAKTPRKSISETPVRPTPKVSDNTVRTKDNKLAPIPNPTLIGTPVLVNGGAWPKTHRVDGTPLLPPTALPSPYQPQPLVPRRILFSTPSGENREDVDKREALIRSNDDKRQILRDQNREISIHPL